jgi:hypothetical protein
MEFDIQPSPSGVAGGISLPEKLRLEIGALLGQCLQLRAGAAELILKIEGPREKDQQVALVSETDYAKIKNTDIQYQILEVTLGCDPEFFVLWEGRRVAATAYLPFAGEIGCDGELGELRPMYGRHENQVVSTLAELIPQIPGKLRRTPWATGFPMDGKRFSYEAHSYYGGVAAGFHVHLGIPPEILNTQRDFSRAAMNHMVQCLDWYLSVPLVPLELSHERRIGRSAYGRPGDYRTSNVTLEYRTPGAFYLRSPHLTRGLLGIALLLTENIVSRLKVASNNFVNLHKLSSADLNEVMPKPSPEKIKGVLVNPNVTAALSELNGIRKQLELLPSFDKHREAVEGFFRAVDKREQPSANMLINWRDKL